MHNFPTWIFWMWQLNLIKGKVLGVTKTLSIFIRDLVQSIALLLPIEFDLKAS
jgi:hypothetical protein